MYVIYSSRWKGRFTHRPFVAHAHRSPQVYKPIATTHSSAKCNLTTRGPPCRSEPQRPRSSHHPSPEPKNTWQPGGLPPLRTPPLSRRGPRRATEPSAWQRHTSRGRNEGWRVYSRKAAGDGIRVSVGATNAGGPRNDRYRRACLNRPPAGSRTASALLSIVPFRPRQRAASGWPPREAARAPASENE